MKRPKKLLLLILVIAILSQAPFAYRRYKLRQLRLAIAKLNSQHTSSASDKFVEYKGVSHVHSALGGHSSGTFEDIIRAAKANGLDFVIMTEHTSSVYNTAALTLQGVYDGVLFINGNERSLPNSDRLLLLPGPAASQSAPSENEITKYSEQGGAVTIVAYPQEFKSWSNLHYDGVEVYNLYTNSRQINPVVMFFDALWSYRTYPDLLFANFYRRPTEGLEIWDRNAGRQKLTAFAGTDAHSNVGLSVIDSSGHPILGIKLDPYERTFQLVRMHVLIPGGQDLQRDTLLTALRSGHSFIGFDILSDSSGFSFTASGDAGEKIQGDEIDVASGVKLNVTTPLQSRIVLFKDGQVIQNDNGVNAKEYPVAEKGVYRVEVYLPQLPGRVAEQPWILSNPIYVR